MMTGYLTLLGPTTAAIVYTTVPGNFATGPIDRIPLIIHKSGANGAQSKTFRTLTAFRPQCLGSIDFPNWAGAVYAIELQKF